MSKIFVLKSESKVTIIPSTQVSSAVIEKENEKEAIVKLAHGKLITIFTVEVKNDNDLQILRNRIQQTIAQQNDYFYEPSSHEQKDHKLAMNPGEPFKVNEAEVLKELPED